MVWRDLKPTRTKSMHKNKKSIVSMLAIKDLLASSDRSAARKSISKNPILVVRSSSFAW